MCPQRPVAARIEILLHTIASPHHTRKKICLIIKNTVVAKITRDFFCQQKAFLLADKFEKKVLFLVSFNKTPTPLLLFTKRVTNYFFQQSDQFIFRSDGLKKIVYKNGALWVATPVRHNNLTS